MRTSLILKQNCSSNYISIELDVQESAKSSIIFDTQDVMIKVKVNDGTQVPLEAIKAASISGALFALRNNVGEYKIVIHRVLFEIDNPDLTIFATVVGIAVSYAIRHDEIVANELVSGWYLYDSKLEDVG